jgi:hypothetical protein
MSEKLTESNFKIYKYPLPITDTVVIEMPDHAQILSIQNQQHEHYAHFPSKSKPADLQIWALVDVTKPMKSRHFRIIGTGHPIYKEEVEYLRYITTVVTNGGSLALHIFELTQPHHIGIPL